MIKQLKISACALAVCIVTANSVFAADSVDVKVIGTITPAACTPTLSGGGTIDYGTMKPSVLAATGYTMLAVKQLDFTITCDAPAKVAVSAINGRLNTVAGSTEGSSTYAAPPAGVLPFGTGNFVAGLGLADTDKIGGYGLQMTPATFTATTTAGGSFAVDNIYASTTTQPWTKSTTGSIFSNGPRVQSWATTGTLIPVAFETLTGKLGVQAYINDQANLDITKPITLDGLATLELVYL